MRHASSSIAAALAVLTARIAPLPSVIDRSSSRSRSPLDTTTSRDSDDELIASSTSATVVNREREPSVQQLTLFLAGITAGDYLASVRDPEPRALGRHLKSVTARAEPLGRRIDVELLWAQAPPALRDAAITAGFPLTPEVVALRPTGF
jgi:hypothetical protein